MLIVLHSKCYKISLVVEYVIKFDAKLTRLLVLCKYTMKLLCVL